MAEIIMGIDHGNGNMKGVHVNFPCGLVRYTSEPGRFMNEDILEYNGVYYTLSETRMPFKADKTVDEDYFILTLFSLALEAKERGRNHFIRQRYCAGSWTAACRLRTAGSGIQKILYGTFKTWNFFPIQWKARKLLPERCFGKSAEFCGSHVL